jgi:hypothetical protein
MARTMQPIARELRSRSVSADMCRAPNRSPRYLRHPLLAVVTVLTACGNADARAATAAQVAESQTAQRATSPETTPKVESVGLDSMMLDGVLRRAESLPRLRTLLVARHGEIQVERHSAGRRSTRPRT